jgi:serine/threonine protein kinase
MTFKKSAVGEADPELQRMLQEAIGSDFVIERELGRGGMAIVYLAQDVHIGRKVAVKVLPPALTHGHGTGFIDRFKREARTAGTLEHPHIIPIHRVSTEGNLFWYVMKYIDGEGLDSVLRREGPLSVRKTTDILAPVADALDYAHRRAVIHRDIKPGNLLLDSDGKVTITDFGIAKAFLGDTLTISGSILGTPYYMSPEQCAGKALTGSADQYSLAVMAYQMLTGNLPFTGESAVEIIKKHTLDPVTPITVLRPGVPRHVAAAIHRALSKAPDERFATVRQFMRAMEFTSEERTEPLTAADKFEILSKSMRLPRPTGVVLATRPSAIMLRPVERVPLSPIQGKLKALARRLEPMTQRLTPALKRAEIVWTGLSRRTQIVTSASAAAVLLTVPVLAWPTTEMQAAAGAPPTVRLGDSSRPQTTVSLPQSGDSKPSPAGPNSVLTLRIAPGGSAVSVNGTRVTGLVDKLALGPGRHVVAVHKEGYRSWTDTITVTRARPIARSVALVPIPARVSLSTSVPASITVNGKSIANPVTSLEVPAGEIRVQIRVRDDGDAWETDSVLTVQPGAHVQKHFQLASSAVAARRVLPRVVPVALPAQLLSVPAASESLALAEGYSASEVDVLSHECARFVKLFWDVMGYDMDVARLCAASAVLVMKNSTPEHMLNFTRFVRTQDGAIETVERPATVAEWRNEVTGKLLRFHLRGDSMYVVDETPSIPISAPTTRRATRSVSVRQLPEGGTTITVVRVDAFGPAVKTPRDAPPVELPASHGHRIGSCSGTLTFRGDTLRFVPNQGAHAFTIGAPHILSGTVKGGQGSIQFRVGADSERLRVRNWEPVFEAVIVGRRTSRDAPK